MANVVGGSGDDLYGGMTRALAVPEGDPGSPEARVHLYGKEPRLGRKLGHVNAYGDDLPTVARRAREAAGVISEFGAKNG